MRPDFLVCVQHSRRYNNYICTQLQIKKKKFGLRENFHTCRKTQITKTFLVKKKKKLTPWCFVVTCYYSYSPATSSKPGIQAGRVEAMGTWQAYKRISLYECLQTYIQSCEALDTAPSTLLLKTSRCKQSRASWLRPGGFFFSFIHSICFQRLHVNFCS